MVRRYSTGVELMNKQEPCLTRRNYSHLLIVLLGLTSSANSLAQGQETTETTVTFRSGSPQLVTVERVGEMALAQDDMIVGYAEDIFSTGKRTRGLSLSLIHISEPTRPY